MTSADVLLAKQVLAEVREQLGPDDLERVAAIKVTAKPRPGPEDIERGAHPLQKCAYYGVPCEQGTPGITELPDPSEATGEILLFLDNLAPLSADKLRIALLHEYGHALGHDEGTLWAMGLYLEDGSPPCTPF